MSEWAISFRRRRKQKPKAESRFPGSDRTVKPKPGVAAANSAPDMPESGAVYEPGLQDSPEPYKCTWHIFETQCLQDLLQKYLFT